MQIIEVIVGPQGETRVTTQGFVGQACRTASQFLETALGSRTHEQLTPEYHQAAPTSEHQQEGQR